MTTLFNKKIKPKPSKVLDTYWKFATQRQDIFFNKITDPKNPIQKDATLLKHKFTNAYRASDRVSQYLIKNVIYSGDQSFREIFFRTLLFKTFNKIETWSLLTNNVGFPSFSEFNIKGYSKILDKAMASGKKIYSGAYIMTSGKSFFGHEKKFKNHLCLLQKMMIENLSDRILESAKMEDVFVLLRSCPTIGNFLAYQYTIDLNYSDKLGFSEMDFVMPGPGAKDGIRKCFINYGEYDETDIIKYVTDNQENEFKRLDLHFKNLWGRRLQLIDCQNLFCEVDKYSRVVHPDVIGISNRKKIKQLYIPKKEKVDYWYPPKWKINHLISYR